MKHTHRARIHVIRFAVTRLSKHGVTMLNNKAVKLNKHKDILATYTDVFNSNATEDKKNREINNKELKLHKKSLKREVQEIQNKKRAINIKIIKESEYIYVVGNEEQSICKIGYSTNPTNRISGIQTGCPYKLKFLLIIKGNMLMEQELHKKYAKQRLNGEWFSYSGPLKYSIEKVSFSDLNISKSF